MVRPKDEYTRKEKQNVVIQLACYKCGHRFDLTDDMIEQCKYDKNTMVVVPCQRCGENHEVWYEGYSGCMVHRQENMPIG